MDRDFKADKTKLKFEDGIKTLCLGCSRLKFLTSKEINSSLPRSGPSDK
jgi:hypothetical protein